MNDLHKTLLEEYFFAYIDRGKGADETPLFTKIVEEPLAVAIARRFQISRKDAENAIELARQEVAL